MMQISSVAKRREQAAFVDDALRRDGAARGSVVSLGMPQSAPGALDLTAIESERLLQVVSRTIRLQRHYELFQLLQREVQYFIPHQILISAWGDFRSSNLMIDVISALPGVRTGEADRCNIADVLRSLQIRWTALGRQPVLLDRVAVDGLLRLDCDCVLHRSFLDMQCALVHGSHDARDGSDSLYLALNAGPIVNGHGVERFRLLADMLIAQIDVAFRRIAALKSPAIPANQEYASSPGLLSAREEEILLWVSEGKTNVEISKILAISSFTVKNHIQQILKKLDAANRTEAVARYRQMGLPPQRREPGRAPRRASPRPASRNSAAAIS